MSARIRADMVSRNVKIPQDFGLEGFFLVRDFDFSGIVRICLVEIFRSR